MTKSNAPAPRFTSITWLIFALLLFAAIVRIEAAPRKAAAAQSAASSVAVGPDDIGGVVTSSKGPEAGVWVIAETDQLPTKFRKIVVTDDQGRYLFPELPKKNYKVWVRGYGLVDSPHVEAMPGKELNLTAVIAPNERAAAQYYPADYWYSLAQVPPKSEFPGTGPQGNGINPRDEDPGRLGVADESRLRDLPPDRRQGHARDRAATGNLSHLVAAWDHRTQGRAGRRGHERLDGQLRA